MHEYIQIGGFSLISIREWEKGDEGGGGGNLLDYLFNRSCHSGQLRQSVCQALDRFFCESREAEAKLGRTKVKLIGTLTPPPPFIFIPH